MALFAGGYALSGGPAQQLDELRPQRTLKGDAADILRPSGEHGQAGIYAVDLLQLRSGRALTGWALSGWALSGWALSGRALSGVAGRSLGAPFGRGPGPAPSRLVLQASSMGGLPMKSILPISTPP